MYITAFGQFADCWIRNVENLTDSWSVLKSNWTEHANRWFSRFVPGVEAKNVACSELRF